MLVTLLWNVALTAGLAIVLTAVCCLRSMRNRPALRHLLWLLLLAKLVTPPLISVPVLPADTRSHDTATITLPSNAATGDRPAGLENVAQANSAAAIDAAARPGATGRASFWRLWDDQATFMISLFAVSLIGTLAFLVIHGVRAVRLHRWLRRAGTENARLAECCSDVASSVGIRGNVQVCVLDARIAPSLLVWRRPILLLPRQFVDDLSPQELRSILAHELAHYLRWDC